MRLNTKGRNYYPYLIWLAIFTFSTSWLGGEIQARQGNSSKTTTQLIQQTAETDLSKQMDSRFAQIATQADQQISRAEKLAQVEQLYLEGVALFKSGQSELAEVKFTSVRQVMLAMDETEFYQPKVHSYFLEIAHQIAELKGAPKLLAEPFFKNSNAQIEQFVRYFQGQGQGVLKIGLARLRKYEVMMRKVFQEEGVPQELIYLGLIESTYNPQAESRAGAVGIWQFMPATAQHYGLKQINSLDERTDPEKSTRAAARYLHDLYGLLGDWQLALAAYNVGEYRILHLIEKTGIKDFWKLSQQGLLPAETSNYVPAVLAAITIAKQIFQPQR